MSFHLCLYCLWLWNGPTFPFFDIYFLGSSFADNNPSSLLGIWIFTNLEILGFDWIMASLINSYYLYLVLETFIWRDY